MKGVILPSATTLHILLVCEVLVVNAEVKTEDTTACYVEFTKKMQSNGPYVKHLKKRFDCDELFESPLYDQSHNAPETCKGRSGHLLHFPICPKALYMNSPMEGSFDFFLSIRTTDSLRTPIDFGRLNWWMNSGCNSETTNSRAVMAEPRSNQ